MIGVLVVVNVIGFMVEYGVRKTFLRRSDFFFGAAMVSVLFSLLLLLFANSW